MTKADLENRLVSRLPVVGMRIERLNEGFRLLSAHHVLLDRDANGGPLTTPRPDVQTMSTLEGKP
jgi:hypothetical protein